jgi:hypothetical protein
MRKLILIVIIGLSIIACKKTKTDDPTSDSTNNTSNTTKKRRVTFFTRLYNAGWKLKFKYEYGKNVSFYVNGQKIPSSNIVDELENNGALHFLNYDMPYKPGDVVSIKFDTAIYSTMDLMQDYARIDIDTLANDGKHWDVEKELAYILISKSKVGNANDIPEPQGTPMYFMCFNKSISSTVP